MLQVLESHCQDAAIQSASRDCEKALSSLIRKASNLEAQGKSEPDQDLQHTSLISYLVKNRSTIYYGVMLGQA